jgi:hypothetical protein
MAQTRAFIHPPKFFVALDIEKIKHIAMNKQRQESI